MSVDRISVDIVKITSGSGVAVHVWGDDERRVIQFRTTGNDNGWSQWSANVSKIYHSLAIAQEIAIKRDGPYWCPELGIYYFRLAGSIECDPALQYGPYYCPELGIFPFELLKSTSWSQ